MGTRITDLPAATIVNPTDVAPIVQSGTTKQAAVSLIKTTNASELTSGTIAVARLPLGTTSSAGALQLGTTAGTACEGSDARLSNSRTPTGSAGGDLTGSYPNPTLAPLSPSPAGTFGSATAIPVVTVNSKGQVTAVSAATAAGTVSSVNVSGGSTGLTFSNGPIVSSGTIVASGTLALANGGTGATTAAGARTNLGLAPSATIDTTNASNIATGTLNATLLSNSGVTAGSYGSSAQIPVLGVDSKGRITSASTVSLSNLGITSLAGDVTASGPGNATATLVNSGVTAGTYGNGTVIPQITVDSKGRVISASTTAISQISTAQLPALTGDVTALAGTGNTILIASGVSAGTYGSSASVPQITVDSKGRVTSATNVGISGSAGGTVTSVGVTSSTLAITNSPITFNGDIGIELPASGVTSGTYGNANSVGAFSVNSKGVITGASSQLIALTTAQISGLAASAITDATNASNITSGTLDVNRMATSGVTAGTYGSTAAIPVLTVDAVGRLTSASTVPISATGAQSADVQVFITSGTWNKPTGAKSVQIQLLGGGGGGASGGKYNTSWVNGGGGGSGGGYVNVTVPASALSTTQTVTIGSGGTGATGRTSNGNDGSNGGAGGTTIFSQFRAIGGPGGSTSPNEVLQTQMAHSGGLPGQGISTGPGGAGNPNSSSTIIFPGGSGGGGGGSINSLNPANGGVGGANLNLNLSGGTAGTPGFPDGGNGIANPNYQLFGPGSGGGGGASSGSISGGNGGAGGFPASGGGGGGCTGTGTRSGSGGNGAAGIAIITTYF